MAFDIFVRVQAKWRGLLVYMLLQAFTHLATRLIIYKTPDSQVQLVANLVSLVTTLYCLINTSMLLFRDQDGDENWPPLWPWS